FIYGFGVGIKGINPALGIVKPQRYIIPKKSFSDAQNGVYDSIIMSVVDKELEKYKILGNSNVEWDLELTPFMPIHVDVSLVNSSSELDIERFKAWRADYSDFEFILDDSGKYIVGHEVEKMSKSKFNVVNPDDICNEYGADTLRLYEMFLG